MYKRQDATNATTEKITATPNTQVAPRHPIIPPSMVVNGVPITADIVDPNDTVATALPVIPFGARRAAIGLMRDQNSPCVNAAVTRAATSTA